MTVGHVNVKSTIERIQKEISKDKSISPVLISSIELLIVVIQMLFDRQERTKRNEVKKVKIMLVLKLVMQVQL